MRLFIAFSFSSDESDRIEHVIKLFEGHMVSGRTTKRDHFHVTLVFLGDTSPSMLSSVKAAMDATKGTPFKLRIKDISAFKGKRKGNTYYMNIQANETLVSIERQLRSELQAYGFSIDQRPYHPHLTIARNAVVKDTKALERLDEKVREIDVKIDRIELFESTLRTHGSIYDILHVKQF